MTKGPDLAIVIGSKSRKPMFGEKPGMGYGKDEDTEDTGDLKRAAMEAFMEAVQDGDAEAALKAWASLPCPAEMESTEEQEPEGA